MQRKAPCASCGVTILLSSQSLGPGKSICQECRRASRKMDCETCGRRIPGRAKRYCSKQCANRRPDRRMVRHATDARTARSLRLADAPGLNRHQIGKLLRSWRSQSRVCTYCDRPADTVDHVVPLVRGGTNHEGNLTPCCKQCNSSKAGWLVIEWRTGKRLPPMDYVPEWDKRESSPKKRSEPVLTVPCSVCSNAVPPGRRSYCSDECSKAGSAAYMRTYMRNRYRKAHDIPLDAPAWGYRPA